MLIICESINSHLYHIVAIFVLRYLVENIVIFDFDFCVAKAGETSVTAQTLWNIELLLLISIKVYHLQQL